MRLPKSTAMDAQAHAANQQAAPVRTAIIGGGWAGLSAAIACVQRGEMVTVYEAARQWGGRARTAQAHGPQGQPWELDNGQHILIGAYHESLRVMRTVGVDVEAALLRLPLDLRDTHGRGLHLPALTTDGPRWLSRIRAHLALMRAIATAPGWNMAQRLALLRCAARWQMQGFRCSPTATVADVCAGLPPVVMQGLIEPLCTAALNLGAHKASGAVFLRVLRDALLGEPGSADLLLPRLPLGTLFAEPATHWLAQQGARLYLGQRVHSIQWCSTRTAAIHSPHDTPLPRWHVHAGMASMGFDRILLATHSTQAARLVRSLTTHPLPSDATDKADARATIARMHRWADTAQALPHTAIGTVYLHCGATGANACSSRTLTGESIPSTSPTHPWPATLPRPMLALSMMDSDEAAPPPPAQFMFDRGQLGAAPGLLALVASACEMDTATLQAQTLAQIEHECRTAQGLNTLAAQTLRPVKTIIEKRATFACTPGVQRPPMHIAEGLLACGDYIEGPYPATLEGAVRSGLAAAQG